jgi:hypothetical protein
MNRQQQHRTNMQNFQKMVSEHKDLVFCYGSIIPGKTPEDDQVIFSIRPTSSSQLTNYEFEVTALARANSDLLRNNYEVMFKQNTISHNFSVLKDRSNFIGTGGVSMPSYAPDAHSHWKVDGFAIDGMFGEYRHGIYIMKSINLREWSVPVKIIDRNWGLKNVCCSYDSQSSLLRDGDIYRLYTRWNAAPQVRKMQVFTTNNIDKWENNAQEVKFDKDINIYTQYVFKHQDKFVAILRYYLPGNYDKKVKMNHQICTAVSMDGINFTITNEKLIASVDGEYPVQGHKIVNGNPVIYLLCQSGKLTEYEITI